MTSYIHPRLGRILRTPDDRFNNLPNFPFKPNYVNYDGIRMHYLDEGKSNNNRIALMLHGEPTWCYLYRKMLPIFVKAGYRCIVPDFIGFGRTDKIVDDNKYDFYLHRNSLIFLIEHLNLKNVTLVCQDWGGLLGLTLPMDLPGRFDRLVVMNTSIATGDVPLGKGFIEWRDYCTSQNDLNVGNLMKRSCSHLTPAEVSAYGAPWPTAEFKAGIRKFPLLVCDKPDAPGAEISRRARDWWKQEWNGQSFMAIGVQDPVLGLSAMRYLNKLIRGCPEPLKIQEAGHFVQEWGEEVANKALQYFDSNKASSKL